MHAPDVPLFLSAGPASQGVTEYRGVARARALEECDPPRAGGVTRAGALLAGYCTVLCNSTRMGESMYHLLPIGTHSNET